MVKEEILEEARRIFADTKVQKGQKHHGAVIGSEENKLSYIEEKIDGWVAEITTLSKIARYAPQQVYACFTAGHKHKLNYCMRSIENIGPSMKRVDDAVTTLLIPEITRAITPTPLEQRLLSLPPSLGGLGIPIFEESSAIEFENSKLSTEMFQDVIIDQKRSYEVNEKDLAEVKTRMKKQKTTRNKKTFNEIHIESSDKRKKLLEIISEKDEGFQLDKQTFWGLIRIRYGYQLTCLPEKCACGAHFIICNIPCHARKVDLLVFATT